MGAHEMTRLGALCQANAENDDDGNISWKQEPPSPTQKRPRLKGGREASCDGLSLLADIALEEIRVDGVDYPTPGGSTADTLYAPPLCPMPIVPL